MAKRAAAVVVCSCPLLPCSNKNDHRIQERDDWVITRDEHEGWRCSTVSNDEQMDRQPPGFIFDLDGTLVDSVYHHVMAWRRALSEVGIPFSLWQIHRRIGMSGGLLVKAVSREAGRPIEGATTDRAKELHDQYYHEQLHNLSPLPGVLDLLEALRAEGYPWAIATSGRQQDAAPMLDVLGLSIDQVALVTSSDVPYAKPDPHLFLAAADLLQLPAANTMIFGDSVWDMLSARRAGGTGIGLLSGGSSYQELIEAHAFRVYSDIADVVERRDELGVRFSRL